MSFYLFLQYSAAPHNPFTFRISMLNQLIKFPSRSCLKDYLVKAVNIVWWWWNFVNT